MAIKRTLTLRYLSALLIVACVIITTYSVLATKIKASADYAATINMAGLQRTLSQRIALSAHAITSATDPAGRSKAVLMMRDASAKMRHHHDMLMMSDSAAELVGESLAGSDLNRQVNAFLDATQIILTMAAQASPNEAVDPAAAGNLLEYLDNGLLEALDGYVLKLQRAAENRTTQFLKLETLFLIIGLVTLILEALFIFRPMVNRIDSTLHGLEIANAELLEFSYRISHDLRAPIASSLGLLKIGREALEEGETAVVSDIIGKTDLSMQRLDTLISDVISVTRSRQAQISMAYFSVAEVIDEIFEKLGGFPGAQSVLLRHEIPADVLAFSNRVFLAEILENLISNGIKYSDPEKSVRFVEISLDELDNGTRITVTDNGLGIPPAQRENVFGMFERFHPNVSFGSGLGLYLVQQNARSLGGTIEYAPTTNGSRFTLKIPKSGVLH